MTDEFNIDEYLKSLSNEALTAEFNGAVSNLEIAANEDRNSEWHESCFAAAAILGEELAKRGIPNPRLH